MSAPMPPFCVAHEMVESAASAEATMMVAGFSLCEECGIDLMHRVLEGAPLFSPALIVVQAIAEWQKRDFL